MAKAVKNCVITGEQGDQVFYEYVCPFCGKSSWKFSADLRGRTPGSQERQTSTCPECGGNGIMQEVIIEF